jgi:hypothetical protein
VTQPRSGAELNRATEDWPTSPVTLSPSAALRINPWELKVRNTALPDERKIEYRIGLNVGDVSIEKGTL